MNKIDRIPLNIIESFIVIVKEGSLESAGKRIRMTQPALSRQMQQLESMLPIKVFTQSGRNKVLTKYGQSIFDTFQDRFSNIEEALSQTTNAFLDESLAEITISGRGELLDRVIEKLSFKGKVSFNQLSNSQVIESLLSRKSDLGIVYQAIDSSELILKPLFNDHFSLVIPKCFSKTWPKDPREQRELLLKLPALMYKKNDILINSFLKKWKIKSTDLNIHRVYSNYNALANIVNLGIGWSILPSRYKLNNKENHFIDLSMSSFNRKFYLCYRKDLIQADWFKDLIQEIKIIGMNNKIK